MLGLVAICKILEDFFVKCPKPQWATRVPVAPVKRGERSAEEEILTIAIIQKKESKLLTTAIVK